MAVKFYLAHSQNGHTKYIGPNAKDYFHLKLEKLKELLPGANITRVMTNVGTRDNLGVTAIFSQKINEDIVSLFNFLGKAFLVENEDQIDLHTVLIGSGPAFFTIC